jgi:acetate kinase
MPLPLRRGSVRVGPSCANDFSLVLASLGVELDFAWNQNAAPDCHVATEGSRVRILVVRAREDLVAARAARSLLASEGDPA